MKIFNRSKIKCNKILWHTVAGALGLNGTLRDADLLDRKELTVVIQKEEQRKNKDELFYGNYTLGRIDIFPCHQCAPGTIFITFLHELGHAWLHEYHEQCYFENWTEEFCERFSKTVFKSIGGSILGIECNKFQLPVIIKNADFSKIAHDVYNNLNKEKRNIRVYTFDKIAR